MLENRMFWEVPVCHLDPADFYTPQEMEQVLKVFFNHGPITDVTRLQAALEHLGIETDPAAIEDRLDVLGCDINKGLTPEAFLVIAIQISEKRVSLYCIDSRRYFTKAKLEEYKTVYKQFDEDQDGELNIDDLAKMFKQLRINIPDAKLRDIFNEADVDGSGVMEFGEFCSLFAKATNAQKLPIHIEYLPNQRLKQLRSSFSGEDSGEFLDLCAKIVKDEGLPRFRRVTPLSIEMAKKLRDDGVEAIELREIDYSLQDLKSAGYTISECVTAGYEISAMLDMGASLTELRDAKVGPLRLTKAGVTAIDLRNAGFSAESIRRACRVSNN